ncbi:MAG: hypothetical protein RL032_1799 [Pseudomonadota bacterium]|jgi:hypothetical protein
MCNVSSRVGAKVASSWRSSVALLIRGVYSHSDGDWNMQPWVWTLSFATVSKPLTLGSYFPRFSAY